MRKYSVRGLVCERHWMIEFIKHVLPRLCKPQRPIACCFRISAIVDVALTFFVVDVVASPFSSPAKMVRVYAFSSAPPGIPGAIGHCFAPRTCLPETTLKHIAHTVTSDALPVVFPEVSPPFVFSFSFDRVSVLGQSNGRCGCYEPVWLWLQII